METLDVPVERDKGLPCFIAPVVTKWTATRSVSLLTNRYERTNWDFVRLLFCGSGGPLVLCKVSIFLGTRQEILPVSVHWVGEIGVPRFGGGRRVVSGVPVRGA